MQAYIRKSKDPTPFYGKEILFSFAQYSRLILGGFGVFIYIIRDVGKKCMVYLFASKKRRKNIILELTRDDVIWNENNFVIASG